MNENQKSVYTLGAEDGLLLGPVMALTAVLFGASTYFGFLFIPALISAFAVPVITYFRLALSFRKGHTASSFSAIWLHGICMYFFGGLIMSVVVYVALRWLDPGFIAHQIDIVVNAYSGINDPQAQTLVNTFEKLKESGSLPTALDTTLELLYFAVFTGSILSLIYSAVIRRRNKRPVPPPFEG